MGLCPIQTVDKIKFVNSHTVDKIKFVNSMAVYKVLYLRIKELSDKWKKPIQNWKVIQQQLIKLFSDRHSKHLKL